MGPGRGAVSRGCGRRSRGLLETDSEDRNLRKEGQVLELS